MRSSTNVKQPSTNSAIQLALDNMHEALRLLDDQDVGTAPAHLQMAIDVIGEATVGQAGDEHAPSESPERPIAADLALVRAIGGALATIIILMSRDDKVTLQEAADLLAVYATISGETCEEGGLILACWSNMISDLGKSMTA